MTAARLKNVATRVILLQTDEAGDITPVTLYRESRKRRRRRIRRECGAIPGCNSRGGCATWALKLCKSPLLAAAASAKAMKSLAGRGWD
jgi:hypothetical protein